MKQIISSAMSISARQIVVAIMNLFVCIALLMFATLIFTEADGYYAVVTKEGESEPVEEYSYSFSKGEDTKKAEYENKGYTVSTVKTRNEMSAGEQIALSIICQIFATANVTAFVYPYIWRMGSEDSNLVKFKHRNEDKLKGAKIGAVAAFVPFVFLVLVFAFFGKLLKTATLAIIFPSFYGFFKIISVNALWVSDLKLWQMLLMAASIFTVPLISHIAYTLGYKNISLGEKFVYKDKENQGG